MHPVPEEQRKQQPDQNVRQLTNNGRPKHPPKIHRRPPEKMIHAEPKSANSIQSACNEGDTVDIHPSREQITHMTAVLEFILIAAGIEYLVDPSRYTLRSSTTAIAWYTASALAGPYIVAYQLPLLEHLAACARSVPRDLLALVVLDDLSQYWSHRLSHRLKPWWLAHRVHHSSTTYNLLLALRNSPAEAIPLTAFLIIPAALGYSPTEIIATRSISILIQHLMHHRSNVKWPKIIRCLFVTPQYHELHHASNPCYWDKNFGAVLCIWDTAFGTATTRTEEPVYGVR